MQFLTSTFKHMLRGLRRHDRVCTSAGWKHTTLALALVTFMHASASAGDALETWDYDPYRIAIWLSIDQTPDLTSTTEAEVKQHLYDASFVVAGATWDLTFHDPPSSLMHDALRSIDLISTEQVEATRLELLDTHDKLMVVSIRREFTGMRIQARELDCRTRVWGPIREKFLQQKEMLPRYVFTAIHEAFAPITRIELVDTDQKKAVVRPRAAGLVYKNSPPILISKGDVLVPVVRRNNRQGQPLTITELPWTYLMVLDQREGESDCMVHSGLRSALTGKTSSRTQRFALGVRLQTDKTELQIATPETKYEASKTLMGYDVYSKDPVLEFSDDPSALQTQRTDDVPPKMGRTDWRGIVDVPKGSHKLRILYVKNGRQLLARLPIVPGLVALARTEVPDDDKRLRAETYNREIQNNILALEVKRQIMAARVRKRIEENKINGPDGANAVLDELRKLPHRTHLKQRVEDYREQVLPDSGLALSSKDKKINNLFVATKTILDRFLDPDLVTKLQTEISNK